MIHLFVDGCEGAIEMMMMTRGWVGYSYDLESDKQIYYSSQSAVLYVIKKLFSKMIPFLLVRGICACMLPSFSTITTSRRRYPATHIQGCLLKGFPAKLQENLIADVTSTVITNGVSVYVRGVHSRFYLISQKIAYGIQYTMACYKSREKYFKWHVHKMCMKLSYRYRCFHIRGKQFN